MDQVWAGASTGEPSAQVGRANLRATCIRSTSPYSILDALHPVFLVYTSPEQALPLLVKVRMNHCRKGQF